LAMRSALDSSLQCTSIINIIAIQFEIENQCKNSATKIP
jgi:hypothetical protein